jgi:hypothetical protein
VPSFGDHPTVNTGRREGGDIRLGEYRDLASVTQRVAEVAFNVRDTAIRRVALCATRAAIPARTDRCTAAGTWAKSGPTRVVGRLCSRKGPM